GVLLKSRPAEVLMRAIRAIVAGEAWIEPLVLARMVGADRVRAVDGVLDVCVDRAEAARVNAGLVAADVAVSELRWHEPDLEQIFLELTGGETHVA
ncbi:MAG: hypothetical protein M3211_11030, partial [Actinomycetota bacterium]|nr:hypothetical protein [Actinomycetota bacterium]